MSSSTYTQILVLLNCFMCYPRPPNHVVTGADGGYVGVYFDVASHLISEVATSHTGQIILPNCFDSNCPHVSPSSAYEFFNSKEAIAASLQSRLDAYFKSSLHATVVSLQIQSCRLPDEFNQAITDTVTQRQNITKAAKFLDQQTVSLQTNLLVAARTANSTIAVAEGAARSLLLQAEVEKIIC